MLELILGLLVGAIGGALIVALFDEFSVKKFYRLLKTFYHINNLNYEADVYYYNEGWNDCITVVRHLMGVDYED